ncbi:MAG: Rrf2 family transcriptional regulator [Candidatus Sumerlaeota bacterium]|nr:Rrf2 family transcriptional regulator [Candidatus Sumerlaeota bacterium]
MFQISTKGRYATRILYRMALFGPDQPIRKVDIAEAEGLTPDYVEQIMTRLYAAGLVKSHRGPKGGFTIGKNPDEITVAEVLDATEGPIAIAPCIEGECARTHESGKFRYIEVSLAALITVLRRRV